ncbi:MAG: PIN domain-containing protein [Opitutales bacterium]
MPNAFIDTNILVYAADETTPLPRKSRIARELLLLPDLYISVQVLNEFIAVARRSDKLNFSPHQERFWIEAWLLQTVVGLDTQQFLDALAFHQRYQVSHWDGLILAAAQKARCEKLYSVDLQHGQRYEEIEVINPFL